MIRSGKEPNQAEVAQTGKAQAWKACVRKDS